MIRPLRARHRAMVPLVALLAAAMIGFGLAARRAAPAMSALPPALLVFDNGSASGIHDVRDGSITLEASAARGPGGDVGVYWAPSSARRRSVPLEGSFWLGRLGDGPVEYRLPDDASRVAGRILLYSLDGQQVIDTARLGRTGEGTPR